MRRLLGAFVMDSTVTRLLLRRLSQAGYTRLGSSFLPSPTMYDPCHLCHGDHHLSARCQPYPLHPFPHYGCRHDVASFRLVPLCMGTLLVASVTVIACKLSSLPPEPMETGMPTVVIAPTGQTGCIKTDLLPLSQVRLPYSAPLLAVKDASHRLISFWSDRLMLFHLPASLPRSTRCCSLQSLRETWQSHVGPLLYPLDQHACEIVLPDTSTVLVPRCQVFLADSSLAEPEIRWTLPPARQRRALRHRGHVVANAVGAHDTLLPLLLSPQCQHMHRGMALATVRARTAPSKIIGKPVRCFQEGCGRRSVFQIIPSPLIPCFSGP